MPPIAAIEAAAIRNNFRFKERRLALFFDDSAVSTGSPARNLRKSAARSVAVG